MEICDQCSVKFSIIKRKYQCSACQLSHCSDCLIKASGSFSKSSSATSSMGPHFLNQASQVVGNFIGGTTPRHCRKCHVFMQWPINVQAVSSLRVKDLRFYLKRHNISASTCTEKSELATLVVDQLRKYREQQQRDFQPQQFQSSRPSTQQAPQSCDLTYSRHSGQPIPHSSHPRTGTIIRDDGIRVQGCNLPLSDSNDSDSIRVFSVASLSLESPVIDSSPTTSDDFVLVEPDLRRPTLDSSPTGATEFTCNRAEFSRVQPIEPVTSIDVPPAGNEPVGAESGSGSSRQDVIIDENSPARSSGSNNPSCVTSASLNKAIDAKGPDNNSTDNVSLDDLPDESSVRCLTVRQCRLLLAKNRVTANAIVEKEQLIERVLTLWRAHQKKKKQIAEVVPDHLLCKICMEAPIDCVLLECSHMVCCTECGRLLAECPVCRQYVVRCVHTFLA